MNTNKLPLWISFFALAIGLAFAICSIVTLIVFPHPGTQILGPLGLAFTWIGILGGACSRVFQAQDERIRRLEAGAGVAVSNNR